MRVGINALLLNKTRAGIGNYIFRLINKFAQRNFDLVIFGEQDKLPKGLSNAKIVSPGIILEKNWQRILWEQLVLPWQSRDKVDLMHYTDYALPLAVKFVPSIITVHDLSFLIYPETFTKGARLTKQTLIGPSVAKADKIIAVSQNTKNDLIKFFSIASEKIKVIYEGFNQELYAPMDQNEAQAYLIKKYNLMEPFFLYVGTLEPRKNIPTLVRAYAIVRDRLGNGCPKLVLAGQKGWLYEDIFFSVKELGLTEEVIFTGYVPDEDLPYFYNAAVAFLYPSLYEGFGVPPLEAMACGTPVITSNTSSLPEVVGEGGIMVDPLDVEALVKAMEKVYADQEFREALSKQGLAQASKFTWKATAEETLALYREVYTRGRDSR